MYNSSSAGQNGDAMTCLPHGRPLSGVDMYELIAEVKPEEPGNNKYQFLFIGWWDCYANVMRGQFSPGPRLNIKTVLSIDKTVFILRRDTYGDFHVKDKTAVRTSYL